MRYDETPFNAPSTRPGEPLTTGMDSGPGPGSQILGRLGGPRVAGMLAQLADQLGDPDLAEMAEMARLQDV